MKSPHRVLLACVVPVLIGMVAVGVLMGTSSANGAALASQPQGGDRVKVVAPPPPPPPIFGTREMADAELALLDAETVLQYWIDQEDKWNSSVATGDQAPRTERDVAYSRQALSNALRAQSSRIDAGLQRERAYKRLEAMRAKNAEVQGEIR